MLLNNIFTAIEIEANANTIKHDLYKYVSHEQISRLRKQLVVVDQLRDRGVKELSEKEMGILLNYPERLFRDQDKLTSGIEKVVSKVCNQPSTAANDNPQTQASEPNRRNGNRSEKKEREEEKYLIPSDSAMVERSDLYQAILMASRARSYGSLEDHVKRRVIDRIASIIKCGDDTVVINKIADTLARAKVLW